MTTVALAVTDGIPLFELAVPIAVLDHAYDLRICGPKGARVGGWLTADPPYGLDEIPRADIVVVPACHKVTEDPSGELIDALKEAHEAGARVASLCTGAFILAAAGLLDGRRATTHWMHAARLAARYPAIDVDPGVLYIDEGDVLTSAGKAAAIDLCLHIVRTDHGPKLANDLARRMVVAPHRPGGQAQFIANPLPDNENDGLADVLAWAIKNLDQPLTVPDLANRAHMSTRNLTRHFAAVTGATPLQWLSTQRIHRAQELLEHTDDSVDMIAGRVGMGSAATLRRHFNRTVGVPPDAYRRAFSLPRVKSDVSVG